MIERLENLSVQAKLAAIVMVVCGALVLLMTFFYTVDKVWSFRSTMVETHTMLAETIAKNSTAALVFRDQLDAGNTLNALRVVDDVIRATIFNREGEVFADYTRIDSSAKRNDAEREEVIEQMRNSSGDRMMYRFHGRYLDLATPIILDDEWIGFISIRADLNMLYFHLIGSIAVVIGLLAVLGLIAQFVSVRLHRAIARPLMDLLDTMEMVTEEQNYSLRVEKLRDDEFGALTDGFNSMLTEIEKREEKLEQHQQNLEKLVQQRTQELVSANEQLQLEISERMEIQDQLDRAQRMEAIGTLAAGVAHDLNNILSGVVSYPELLLMRLPKDHEMEGPLITIQNSGKKAAAIVQDLLTLARRGGQVMETVDLEKVIDEYLASAECERLLEHHPGVEIEKQVTSSIRMIVGSPIHLGKTVMNLITNGAEAIGSGQGTIRLTLENCYLERAPRGYSQIKEGYYTKLTVSDTGHGISEEDLRFIFEPFYTKKKMGRSGTGLGMAVVWGAVEDHKGYIEVDSREGIGTSFTLYFPASKVQMLRPESVDADDVVRGGGESILVVDDVREQRLIATDILRELGYNVDAVASGEAAVSFVKSRPVDLLLLDMIMDPGIDGIETYRQIRQRYPRQRAIIASGYSESNRVQFARELGLVSYLHKPYTVIGLARAVREELTRTQEQDSIDN